MGLDLGLEQTGFITQVLVELDPIARQTIQHNLRRLGRTAAIFEDVTQVTAEMLLEAAGLRIGEVTLISGGPPVNPSAQQGAGRLYRILEGAYFETSFVLSRGCGPASL